MRVDVQFPPATASATGLLTTVLLLFVTGIVWSLLSVRYRSRLAQVLPAWLWRRVALTVPGWEVYHKSKPFDNDASVREGKSQSFVLVGPSTFEVWTVDPVAVHDVQQRVHDFEQAKALAVLLGKYGPNVITSNGERWARYRRPVATVLNERISGANFEAAVRHTEEVFGPALPLSSGHDNDDATNKINVPQLFDMITKLTFNVLISASIGDDKFPWSSEEAQGRRESGYKFTYTESLHLFLDNFYGISMLPLSVINGWPKWLTGYEKVSAVGQAITEYRQRMRSMLDLERDRLASEKQLPSQGKADLLALLVKASEDEAHTGMALTNDELVANLFVFIAGGFKTIAAALQTALVALAAYPQWQDWLLEEVDAIVSSSSENADSWEYAKVFPQAVRHVAFILEMMRLHGSSTRLTRIASGPQTMQTSGATVHIPAKTRVHVDSMALHVLPCWAGINRQSDPSFVHSKTTDTGDEYSFRPSRWINPPGSDKTHYLPPKGTYVPWGTGPRVCPGQKMAQVEITTVMLRILKDHRVEACPSLPGETKCQAEEKFQAALHDVQWGGILQLKRNKDLCIKFTKRK
ncbi:cytochrome CYP13A3 [Apiospora hydei]|uniref:Cytochrome CYP13A3 n=1 Tax=Apiospora hydei TaxID=1337664 RepID=A0ABR1X970_9PEZI